MEIELKINEINSPFNRHGNNFKGEFSILNVRIASEPVIILSKTSSKIYRQNFSS
jgi:hypothetical protein